jgi:hypothetical protein
LSLPLNRRRWLAGDVVRDPGDAADFIDDPTGYALKKGVGQVRPAGGHEVNGLHRAKGDDIFMGTTIPPRAEMDDYLGVDKGNIYATM